jgi:copper ion binding protein
LTATGGGGTIRRHASARVADRRIERRGFVGVTSMEDSMKHVFVVLLGAALWLVPAGARACGDCDHGEHHAAAHSAHSGHAATAKLGPGEARVEIPVAGMHCGHCASRVEAAVQKLDGVKAASVQLQDGKVVVVFEKARVAPAKIVETIDALGYKAGAPTQG